MMIATFAACASTRTHESAGEYVDDSVITTKVKSLLAQDDFLKSFQISVETYQGTVQLSGFANGVKRDPEWRRSFRPRRRVSLTKADWNLRNPLLMC